MFWLYKLWFGVKLVVFREIKRDSLSKTNISLCASLLFAIFFLKNWIDPFSL